jgi:hypothetical protein
MQDPVPIASVDSPALDAFHSEMARRQIDMNLYNLRFYETQVSFLILADYKLRDPRLRGSDPRHPSYEVVISRADFSITSVSIAR